MGRTFPSGEGLGRDRDALSADASRIQSSPDTPGNIPDQIQFTPKAEFDLVCLNPPVMSAAERDGKKLKGFNDLDLKAQARIWP